MTIRIMIKTMIETTKKNHLRRILTKILIHPTIEGVGGPYHPKE